MVKFVATIKQDMAVIRHMLHGLLDKVFLTAQCCVEDQEEVHLLMPYVPCKQHSNAHKIMSPVQVLLILVILCASQQAKLQHNVQ
jgi:hypothetical protein